MITKPQRNWIATVRISTHMLLCEPTGINTNRKNLVLMPVEGSFKHVYYNQKQKQKNKVPQYFWIRFCQNHAGVCSSFVLQQDLELFALPFVAWPRIHPWLPTCYHLRFVWSIRSSKEHDQNVTILRPSICPISPRLSITVVFHD